LDVAAFVGWVIQNGDPIALPQCYIHFFQLTIMLQDYAHGDKNIHYATSRQLLQMYYYSICLQGIRKNNEKHRTKGLKLNPIHPLTL
jgi:hypothetical protein